MDCALEYIIGRFITFVFLSGGAIINATCVHSSGPFFGLFAYAAWFVITYLFTFATLGTGRLPFPNRVDLFGFILFVVTGFTSNVWYHIVSFAGSYALTIFLDFAWDCKIKNQ